MRAKWKKRAVSKTGHGFKKILKALVCLNSFNKQGEVRIALLRIPFSGKNFNGHSFANPPL